MVDAAYRMPCAADYVASSLIVAAGAVIGARCGVRPKEKDDWVVIPNLWGACVGDPSQKKTPGISEGMRGINKLVAKASEAFKAAQADASLGKLIAEAKHEAFKKDVKKSIKSASQDTSALKEQLKSIIVTTEEEPELKRYKTNDATVEKLGELLQKSTQGLLVSRDEIVGLLATWDRSGHEGDRAFFLEAWNGNDAFDTDRIGRGSIFIPNLCLSLFGGIQPDKLTGYLEQASDALANDGMLQRFQVLVYPDPVRWEYRDETPDREARQGFIDVFEQLDGFDPLDWGAKPSGDFAKFPYFEFDKAAQAAYIQFSTSLHRSIEAEDNPLIRQHLAKYDKLFPALALVLHLIDCAATGERGPVSEEATLRAVAWCRYLESHARRCYGLIADEGLSIARQSG